MSLPPSSSTLQSQDEKEEETQLEESITLTAGFLHPHMKGINIVEDEGTVENGGEKLVYSTGRCDGDTAGFLLTKAEVCIGIVTNNVLASINAARICYKNEVDAGWIGGRG